jgi:phosphoribosylformimino-5-aminoimidazole carboxamide ribotide isomerase
MIIPAIDMIAGRTVRLYQGDYAQVTFYEQTPESLVRSYDAGGAAVIHVVDLQGAKDPEQRQIKEISRLVKVSGAPIQTGGGIRSEADVAQLLDVGVGRVIIGSLAIKQPELVKDWVRHFGVDQIVLALDVSMDPNGNKWLPTQGWQASGEQRLEDILNSFLEVDIKHILCTDISRDGTLQGSNTSLYSELVANYPQIVWQASGGIGSLDDIAAAARTGASGVIVGKALLDGKFSYEEASQCWQNA